MIPDVKKQLYKTCQERFLSLFCSLILGSEKKCDSFFKYIVGLIFFFFHSFKSVCHFFVEICGTFPAKMIALFIFQSDCIKDMFSVWICLYFSKAVLCLSCIKYRCFDLNLDVVSIVNCKYWVLTHFFTNLLQTCLLICRTSILCQFLLGYQKHKTVHVILIFFIKWTFGSRKKESRGPNLGMWN